jgi:hypothetical protein
MWLKKPAVNHLAPMIKMDEIVVSDDGIFMAANSTGNKIYTSLWVVHGR